MRNIKTPRDAKGMSALRKTQTTFHDLVSTKVPTRSGRSLHHCHHLKGAREIPRIDRREWEPTVAEMLHGLEKQRLNLANRFYHALDQVRDLLQGAHEREEKMQATSEELESNYEELQATSEEMESTNEELQATTEEMERSVAYRQILMNSMADILMTTDSSGIITEVNRATEEITGYSQEELVGKPFASFFSEPERAQAGIEQVLGENKVSDYELTIVTKDGKNVPVSYNATVLKDPEGRITGVLGSARDNTDAKRAGEALRVAGAYNRSLVEGIPDPIVSINKQGKINDVNDATELITGWSREELIGKDFSDYFTDPEKAREGYQQAFKEGSAKDYQLDIRHRDGHVLPVLYNASVYRDEAGKVAGVIAGARDMTQIRQKEEELNEMSHELSRSNEELQRFAYVAAHDLQEPLRMVASYVQLLEKRYKDKLDNDANEFINYAVDGAKRMQNLINALLSYSRVSTHGKDFTPVECDALLAQAIFNLQAAIEESGAVITHDPLPTVMADEVQLGQLFQNLIGNAIKFRSEETPRVHVSAERVEKSARHREASAKADGPSGEAGGQTPKSKITKGWIFSVRDNGIGIDQEYAERIFIIFQRLHGKEEYPGTGIGLAVCKRILDRHNGGIWVESQIGKGSIFWFTIPDTDKA